MGLHLLISVFVTSSGLNRYRLGSISPNPGEIFRISRFLSSCSTLARVEWDSVAVHVELDTGWQSYEGTVRQAITAMYPEAAVTNRRLETRAQWAEAAASYSSADVILLQTNDDHALVVDDASILARTASKMLGRGAPPMAYITHFCEAQALTYRKSSQMTEIGDGDTTISQTEAIGTTLVRGDFFSSWWVPGRIPDSEKIVRPDNPFGKSVAFAPTQTIIPRVEIMRHMDGYSHIGLYRPLPPLRNLLSFVVGEGGPVTNGDAAVVFNSEQPHRFASSYWPSHLFGYSGVGADLHRVTPASFGRLADFQADVAQLQASWGLRIGWRSARRLLSPSRDLPAPYVAFVAFVAIATPPVLRNLPDAIMDFVTLPVKLATRHLNPRDPWPGERINYAGWTRVIAADRRILGFGRFADWEISQRPVAFAGRILGRLGGTTAARSQGPKSRRDKA